MVKHLHRLFPALYPAPVLLVTCVDADGTPNVATVSWAGIVASDPPQVAVGLRPYRFSNALIRGSGEFAINCPTEEMLAAVDHCGMASGRDAPKLPSPGLTPEPASQVRAPLIKECPLSLECRVTHTLDLGSHTLFVGEIVAVQVEDSVLTPDGLIDYRRVRGLALLGNEYHRIGKCLGTEGLSLKTTRG